MRWGGRTGQLVLAPSDGPEALVYFYYLVFRWRQAGHELAIGLHAWEPFHETVQTLQAVVDRLRSVPSTPIAQTPDPNSHPVPSATPPAWFTLACRSLRTRAICPTQIPDDYEWLHLLTLDAQGRPLQKRGVTPVPGLYLLGLHWMSGEMPSSSPSTSSVGPGGDNASDTMRTEGCGSIAVGLGDKPHG